MSLCDLSAFTEDTKAQVQAAFALDGDLRLLSDWHAFTFEGSQRGHAVICRVTPASHRTPAAIGAELEWQQFTIEHGIAAPRALPSAKGNLLEVFPSGNTSFTAVLFEKLKGRAVGADDWNSSLFAKWGRLVGSLHALSPQFRPKVTRAAWDASDFLDVNAYIPDADAAIKSAAARVIADVRALPQAEAAYGMIHGDVYQDNFLIGPTGLQLFDFDNCEYGFYVSDIAIALYGALWRLDDEKSKDEFARLFMSAFLSGYRQEFNLPAEQLERLPLFLKLREVLIYTVGRKKRDVTTLSPKARRLFEERGARIARGEAIVSL